MPRSAEVFHGAGAQALFQFLAQMSNYDPLEHSLELSQALQPHLYSADSTPTQNQVTWALIDVLRDAANGRHLELTMLAIQATGNDSGADSPTTSTERFAVKQAELYARRLANYLVGIIMRPRHELYQDL